MPINAVTLGGFTLFLSDFHPVQCCMAENFMLFLLYFAILLHVEFSAEIDTWDSFSSRISFSI